MLSNFVRNARNVKKRVVDQRQPTLRRLGELYRDGGIREVGRGIRDYYRYNVADETYQDARVDNEDRWTLVERYVEPDHESLTDLGCADGFFAERAGELGLDVLGLEHNQNRVDRTASRLADASNVEVRQLTLAPDTIEDVPRSDVILFLTVHHHWVWQYGWSEAADMFRTVCDRAELVFYEPPGTHALESDDELDPDDSEAYYRSVLDDLFGDDVTVLDVRMVAYKGGERSDPVFVLDTSNYRYRPDA